MHGNNFDNYFSKEKTLFVYPVKINPVFSSASIPSESEGTAHRAAALLSGNDLSSPVPTLSTPVPALSSPVPVPMFHRASAEAQTAASPSRRGGPLSAGFLFLFFPLVFGSL